MSRKVVETVSRIVSPILDAEGFELVDIEYKKEGSNWFLRIFIDCEERPIDLDDCTHMSELISKKLDEVDPIPEAYFLEVSSPGAERPLKKEADYQRAIGKNVCISTYAPIEGQKEIQGVLTAVNEKHLTVESGTKTMLVPREKVAKARLAIVF